MSEASVTLPMQPARTPTTKAVDAAKEQKFFGSFFQKRTASFSSPIIIAAGGTGGHFFPAEALAATLIARGHRIVLMTDQRSGAARSKVFGGHDIHVLAGAGIAGRGIVRGARAIFSLAAGTWRARGLLGSLNAGVIVGFGGYPSVPPVLAALGMRKPPAIILHEQNAVLGRANRFLAKHVSALALGFAETSHVPAGVAAMITGNPVRGEIATASGRSYETPGDILNLLVLGGSLGARVFSDIVPGAIGLLPDSLRNRLRIVQQCRAEDLARVRDSYAALGIDAELSSFFIDVADRLLRANLVIARAGASTCAELAAVGRPSILVPLPGAIDDHQSANAAALVHAGAARLLPQENFTAESLAAALQESLQAHWLTTAAHAAAALANVGAADALADLVEAHLQRAGAAA